MQRRQFLEVDYHREDNSWVINAVLALTVGVGGED
jgi:hypothetical protein